MTKRPVCLMFLILILIISILNFFNINLYKASNSYENIFLNKNTSIIGTIKNKDIKDTSTQILLSDNVISNKFKVKNIILIFQNKSIKNAKFNIGEKICINGKIEKITSSSNDGQFDPYVYYGLKNIFYKVKNPKLIKIYGKPNIFYNLIEDLKEKAKDNLKHRTGCFYSIYQGITMGETKDINKSQGLIFKEAGISHIFAISGLHLSIIGCILFWIITNLRIHRFLGSILVSALLLLFGIFVGNSLSAVRGISMFMAAALGKIIGRKNDMPQIMSLAGILIILQSPLALYSPSFYLSFTAVFAASVYSPKLIRFFRVKSKLLKAFISIISVFILTFPVMSYFFGEVSIVGIILNFIIIPTAFIVLLCGIIIMICGKFFILCVIPMIIGNTLIFIYEKLSYLAIKLPFSTLITGRCNITFIVIYYSLVICSLTLCSISLRSSRRKIKELVFLIISITLIFGLFFSKQNEGFQICNLDIYKGNCTVVILPNNHAIIYNCGSKKSKNLFINTILPFLKIKGVKYIDGIIISGNGPEYISGFKELCTLLNEECLTIKVKNLFFNGNINTQVARALCKKACINLFLYKDKIEFSENGCKFLVSRRKVELNYIDLNAALTHNNIQISVKGLKKIELKNKDLVINSSIVGNIEKNGEIDIVYKNGKFYIRKNHK